MLAPRPTAWLVAACLQLAILPACDASSAERAAPPEPPEAAASARAEPGRAAATGADGEWLGTPVELPLLRIRLDEAGMKALETRRRQALEDGVLARESGDYTKVEIAEGDGAFGPAKLRLKGDWTDHLTRTHKWSMRVKVKGEHSILGMRVFSLQHPDTRAWLNEWQLHDHMKREGVLALRYRFVRVEINGAPWGIYALEEHFSKELLEHSRRREGVIVKLDEDRLWSRLRIFPPRAYEWTLLPDDFRLERSAVFRRKKTKGSPVLAGGRDAALSLLQSYADRSRSAAEVFDVDELGRFLAINELWSNSHGMRWHNLRFYFDPVTTRLSPIAFDAHAGEPQLLSIVARAPWSRQALEDPEVAAAFVRHLSRISTEAYLDELAAAQRPRLKDLLSTLRTEFENAPLPVHEELRQKATLVRGALSLPRIVRARASRGPQAGVFTLTLRNTTRLPVQVAGVRVEGHEQLIALTDQGRPLLLAPYSEEGTEQRQLALRLPAAVMDSPASARDGAKPGGPQLELVAHIVGLDEPRSMRVQMLDGDAAPTLLPPTPTLAQALAAHRFLERLLDDAGPRALSVRPGAHRVAGDLVLPEGYALRVGAGTRLSFAPGAIMVVGSSLELIGSAEAPVVLDAQQPEQGWGGLLVHGGKPSRLEHATVRGAASIDRGGFVFTGGVTFHRSPVSLIDSRFEDSKAEDMVNVIGARAECLRSTFEGGVSDGFDGDWVDADFEQCQFLRIAGDAVDVSGSRVLLRDCAMSDVGDKAISAGEESVVRVQGVRIVRASVGIASKDLADVEAVGVTLDQVKLAFAAYQKKAEYGPGKLVANEVRVVAGAMAAVAQIDSHVQIDGEVITASGVLPPELGLQAPSPPAPPSTTGAALSAPSTTAPAPSDPSPPSAP